MMDTDIDKVVMSLNVEKELLIDDQTLMAVQPQIQWVADMTVYLLSSLPSSQGYVQWVAYMVVYQC